MKSKLKLLILAIIGLSMPVIAIVLLTFCIWALTGLSVGWSLLASFATCAVGAIALYRKLHKEILEFSIELDLEDDDEII